MDLRSNGGPCDRISVVLSQDGRPVSAYYAPVNWWKKQANADYLNEVEIMVKALAENSTVIPTLQVSGDNRPSWAYYGEHE